MMTYGDIVVIIIIGLRDWTLPKMVCVHKQTIITPEGMVQYGPLSNLKKTLW